MNLKRITAPVATPVSLAEAKAHLRVDGVHEDALITTLVQAATDHLDGWSGVLGRCLVTQTWELHLDAFPAGAIRLPLTPLQSVVEVTYSDSDGVIRVVDPANYYVDTVSSDGWVVPVSGYSWPSTLDSVNVVTVEFVAGYGLAADVPAPIKAAIMLTVADLFDNRGGTVQSSVRTNPTIDRLLNPYRAAVTL